MTSIRYSYSEYSGESWNSFTSANYGVDTSPKQEKKRFWNSRRKERVDEAIYHGEVALKVGVKAGGIGKKIHTVATLIKNAGKATVKTASKIARTAGGAFKALSLAAVPFAFHQLYSSVVSFVRGDDHSDRIDAVLSAADATDTLVGSTIAAAEMLVDFGAVSSQAITWVDPLGYVAAALSGVTLLVNGKGLWDSYKFKKKINSMIEGEKLTPEQFNQLIDYIQKEKEKKLAKQLKVNPQKFKLQMAQIREIVNQNIADRDTDDAQKLMEDTLKLIKKRVVRKQLKHGIAMVGAVVSSVGLAVLLFTPAAPVGYSLLAIAAAVSLGKVIYDYVETRKFKKQLGMDRIIAEELDTDVREKEIKMQTFPTSRSGPPPRPPRKKTVNISKSGPPPRPPRKKKVINSDSETSKILPPGLSVQRRPVPPPRPPRKKKVNVVSPKQVAAIRSRPLPIPPGKSKTSRVTVITPNQVVDTTFSFLTAPQPPTVLPWERCSNSFSGIGFSGHNSIVTVY